MIKVSFSHVNEEKLVDFAETDYSEDSLIDDEEIPF